MPPAPPPRNGQLTGRCFLLRRIYFSDRLYSEEELPPEFKLFLPIQVRTQPMLPRRPTPLSLLYAPPLLFVRRN